MGKEIFLHSFDPIYLCRDPFYFVNKEIATKYSSTYAGALYSRIMSLSLSDKGSIKDGYVSFVSSDSIWSLENSWINHKDLTRASNKLIKFNEIAYQCFISEKRTYYDNDLKPNGYSNRYSHAYRITRFPKCKIIKKESIPFDKNKWKHLSETMIKWWGKESLEIHQR